MALGAIRAFAFLEIGVGFLLPLFRRFAGFRCVGGHVLVFQRFGDLRHERLVPFAHACHGLVEAGAVAADHGAGDGVGQGVHVPCDGAERAQSVAVVVEGRDLVHVLVEHGVDELHRARLAQWLGVLVEADEQSVLAHDGLEERVVCGDFRLEEGRARDAMGVASALFRLVACHGRGDSRQQFRGGFAREGQSQDFFRADALSDEGDDAPGHGVGFAGAGACHDDDVLVGWGLDDGGLFRAVGDFRFGRHRGAFVRPHVPVHATVLSNMVFCSPWQAGQTSLHRQYPTCSGVGRAVMRVARLAAAA